MLAVIETGGKQYVVEPGTKLTVERLAVSAGLGLTRLAGAPAKLAKAGFGPATAGDISFDKVLLTAHGDTVEVGAPYLANRTVAARVLGDVRGERKVVFRFHSKTRYRKYKTHRQPYTQVAIVG